MACTQNCNQGRDCTCGNISPALYKAIAVDVWLLKVITLGRSKPGETISAAAYRGEQKGLWFGKIFRPIIDFLLQWWGPQPHCKHAYEWQRNIYGE